METEHICINDAAGLAGMLTGYIGEDSKSLLDLGRGTAESKEILLRATPEYWGVDYADEGNDAVMDQYNSGEFPEVEADTVLCAGCLEYIEDPDAFLRKMCMAARKEIILSYTGVNSGETESAGALCGRKNNMTPEELMRRFRLCGLAVQRADRAGSTMIWKLINERRMMIRVVQWKKLTYLEAVALYDLMEAVAQTNDLPGCMIETGCALGGSGICMAHEKKEGRSLFVYDVFGMIPAPGEKDGTDVIERYDVIKQGKSRGIGGDTYYGYKDNLMQEVEYSFCELLGLQSIREKDITLVKGLFEDTLTGDLPVSLAHIDCDWYDSVTVCLERIVPRLVQGGMLVIDDYDHWSGCRKAVDDYFRDKKESYLFVRKSRLHIIKK